MRLWALCLCACTLVKNMGRQASKSHCSLPLPECSGTKFELDGSEHGCGVKPVLSPGTLVGNIQVIVERMRKEGLREEGGNSRGEDLNIRIPIPSTSFQSCVDFGCQKPVNVQTLGGLVFAGRGCPIFLFKNKRQGRVSAKPLVRESPTHLCGPVSVK